MSRLHGGVYIANTNGLRGDIVTSSDNATAAHKKLVVRLRGSKGTEIPVNDQELVEYMDAASEQSVAKQEEDIRYHLYQTAQQSDDFYLQERILSLELGDEFTYLVVSNSLEDDGLAPDIEAQALVRLVEAFYIGQGCFCVGNGRDLISFHKALWPFWKQDDSGTQFSKLQGETPNEIFRQLQHTFHGAISGLVFFRAFCYAQHRLDYHRGDDSLLDAYCVVLYVMKLLQGKIDEFKNMVFAPVIEEEFAHNKTSSVDMTADDLLWCFGILLLRIGTDVRRHMGMQSYNTMFSKPFDFAMNEELYVAQLVMELRSESPVSFLSAYRMVMDVKPIVPEPFRKEWMKTTYEYAVHGLASAEAWGDPFFEYTFYMIMAYWLPTSTNAPNPYSLGEIQDLMRIANEFKEDCENHVPEYMLFIGRQHETSLHKLLEVFSIDRDTNLTKSLVDAFTYHVPGSDNEEEDTTCAHCCKPFERRLQCFQCGEVQYCSKPCQVAHWKTSHGKECSVKKINDCGNCGKVLQKKLCCSKCNQISYCNRKCQLEHWKGGHKQECKKITATAKKLSPD
jgi:hypothetical protein